MAAGGSLEFFWKLISVEMAAHVERNLFVRSPHCCFVTIA
jgi:hypothetical protein